MTEPLATGHLIRNPFLRGAATMRNDYEALRPTRHMRKRTGFLTVGTTADWHMRVQYDLIRLIEFCRELDRNTIAGQMLDKAASNVVGDGVPIEAHTGDKEVDDALNLRWEEYRLNADQCDVAGEMTVPRMEWIAQRDCYGVGDIFAWLTPSGHVQMFESYRAQTPTNTSRNVVHGILLDELRRHLEYWFVNDNIPPMEIARRVGDITPLKARYPDGRRQVLHFRDERRATQTRGISAFAKCFIRFSNFDDLQFGTLIQALAASCWTMIRTRPLAAGFGGGSIPGSGAQSTNTMEDGRTQRIQSLSPGQTIEGEPGEAIVGFHPEIPNPQYHDYVTMLLQEMAANVDLPLICLMLDGTATNFTGWRGARNEAQVGWTRSYHNLARRWSIPINRHARYAWAQKEAFFAKALRRLGPRYYGATYHSRSWPYIQPEIEAQADATRIQKLLSSRRRIFGERGADSDAVDVEIVRDNAHLIEAALDEAKRLSVKYAREIDPRQLIYVDPHMPLYIGQAPGPLGAMDQPVTEQEPNPDAAQPAPTDPDATTEAGNT